MLRAGLLLLFPVLAVASDWPTDFDKALETAQEAKKPVLVYVLDSV